MLTLVTPASVTVIDLQEAKDHLRVIHDDEDNYITALCVAATDYLSGEVAWLGVSVVPQTWRLSLSAFPPSCGTDHLPYYGAAYITKSTSLQLRLPKPPVSEVTSITYVDTNGDDQTYTDYRVSGLGSLSGAVILPNRGTSWPAAYGDEGSVEVTFVSGYDSPPDSIKHAAKLLVGHWFETREAATDVSYKDLPFAVNALLAPYRRYL